MRGARSLSEQARQSLASGTGAGAGAGDGGTRAHVVWVVELRVPACVLYVAAARAIVARAAAVRAAAAWRRANERSPGALKAP